jgi:hypothetical protein
LNLFNAKDQIKDLTEWQVQEKTSTTLFPLGIAAKLLAHAKDLPEAQDLPAKPRSLSVHHSEPDPITPPAPAVTRLCASNLPPSG